MKRTLSVMLLVSLLSLAVLACEPATDERGLDAAAQLACQDFTTLLSEGQAGLLSWEESREQARKVYDKARYSQTSGVADAARRLLAAFTARVHDDVVAAGVAMANACRL